MSVHALELQHSVRVEPLVADRIREYGAVRTPTDLARLVASAEAELLQADHVGDTVGVISSLRRLVAIGGLAKAAADRLERS